MYAGRPAFWSGVPVIVGFKDKQLPPFIEGAFVREFEAWRRQIEKRVAILDAAAGLADLRALPSNRLEALRGDRAGYWSIRVNLQWRLCFEWPEGAAGPMNVELVDYH